MHDRKLFVWNGINYFQLFLKYRFDDFTIPAYIKIYFFHRDLIKNNG